MRSTEDSDRHPLPDQGPQVPSALRICSWMYSGTSAREFIPCRGQHNLRPLLPFLDPRLGDLGRIVFIHSSFIHSSFIHSANTFENYARYAISNIISTPQNLCPSLDLILLIHQMSREKKKMGQFLLSVRLHNLQFQVINVHH